MPRPFTMGMLWTAGLVAAWALASEPTESRTEDDANSGATTEGSASVKLAVSSPAFKNNEPIEKRFTGDGEDYSPELNWTGVPEAAKELALICNDPDAPTAEPWVHWVMYKIPASSTGLSVHIAAVEAPSDPKGALQGKNSWGGIGYRGPAPPPGKIHHYHFKLYALDTALSVKAGLTKQQLLAAMADHIVATGELIGTYRR